MRLRRAMPRVRLSGGMILAFCFVSAAGFAQTTSKPIAATAAQRGKDTFQHSCAVCQRRRVRGAPRLDAAELARIDNSLTRSADSRR